MQPKKLPICKKIAEAMLRAGVNRQDLAQRADITEASVSRYLSGKSEPRSAELGRIAITLGVSVDWFLGLTDDPSLKKTAIPVLPDLPAVPKSIILREDAPSYGDRRNHALMLPSNEQIDAEEIDAEFDLIIAQIERLRDRVAKKAKDTRT